MIEIERKYLVTGDFHGDVIDYVDIRQGYILSSDDKSVRVRIAGEKAFLTIKASITGTSVSRYEFESEIDVSEAADLYRLCDGKTIMKRRYIAQYQSQKFVVDVYKGENQGLIIAEIETDSEETNIVKPLWLGKEVTGEKCYTNVSLAHKPYSQW